MEKASGGSFARTIRKTAEDEGRRRGRAGLGHEAPRTITEISQPRKVGYLLALAWRVGWVAKLALIGAALNLDGHNHSDDARS